MKIKLTQTFGRRRVMGSAKILPGIYDADDPALFGLGNDLLAEGFATPVADEETARVTAPAPPASKPVGITHEEYEKRTGRVPPERPEDLGADGDRDGEDAATDDADYQSMTKGQLLNIAAAGGLELSERLNKQAIIDALIAHGKK
jgi:hypothetical protein